MGFEFYLLTGYLFCCAEIKSKDDLVGPGAPDGTVPTDLEQATGLERLELLGKLEGKDIFDMTPLDSSRKGTQLEFPSPIGKLEDVG